MQCLSPKQSTVVNPILLQKGKFKSKQQAKRKAKWLLFSWSTFKLQIKKKNSFTLYKMLSQTAYIYFFVIIRLQQNSILRINVIFFVSINYRFFGRIFAVSFDTGAAVKYCLSDHVGSHVWASNTWKRVVRHREVHRILSGWRIWFSPIAQCWPMRTCLYLFSSHVLLPSDQAIFGQAEVITYNGEIRV